MTEKLPLNLNEYARQRESDGGRLDGVGTERPATGEGQREGESAAPTREAATEDVGILDTVERVLKLYDTFSERLPFLATIVERFTNSYLAAKTAGNPVVDSALPAAQTEGQVQIVRQPITESQIEGMIDKVLPYLESSGEKTLGEAIAEYRSRKPILIPLLTDQINGYLDETAS